MKPIAKVTNLSVREARYIEHNLVLEVFRLHTDLPFLKKAFAERHGLWVSFFKKNHKEQAIENFVSPSINKIDEMD